VSVGDFPPPPPPLLTMEFVIPEHPEDLETAKTAAGHAVFHVESVIDPTDCLDPLGVLDEISDQLLNGDVLSLALSNAVFDPLYSFTKCVDVQSVLLVTSLKSSPPPPPYPPFRAWVGLSSEAKFRLLEVLSSAVQEAVAFLKEPSGVEVGRPANVAQRRNGFKAIVYLFAVCIQVAEKTTKDAQGDLGGVAPQRKGKVSM
jgi:hypothetical protein